MTRLRCKPSRMEKTQQQARAVSHGRANTCPTQLSCLSRVHSVHRTAQPHSKDAPAQLEGSASTRRTAPRAHSACGMDHVSRVCCTAHQSILVWARRRGITRLWGQYQYACVFFNEVAARWKSPPTGGQQDTETERPRWCEKIARHPNHHPSHTVPNPVTGSAGQAVLMRFIPATALIGCKPSRVGQRPARPFDTGLSTTSCLSSSCNNVARPATGS
jgi:hypothetical protein